MTEHPLLMSPIRFAAPDGSLRIVRSAQRPDLEAICQIERAANMSPWTQGDFEDYLAGGMDGPIVLVCCRESSYPDAFAVGREISDEFEILSIAVAPEEQGKGVGLILMMSLLRWAKSRGIARWILEVREGNTVARKLYASCGFFETGKRHGYYADTNEAAILMTGESPVPWEVRQEMHCFRGVKLFNQ
jgi:ribosomal-protein-alanine acetyltransferase